MSTPIQITPSLPPGPFTLADSSFVTALADAEARIAVLKIVDAATAQDAANLQITLTTAGKSLEAKRLELLRPALDWQNLINGTARPVTTRIDIAKKLLSDGLSTFAADQARAVAEAERVRLVEVARLQKIADAEAARLKAEADAALAVAVKAEADRLAKLSTDQRQAEAELSFADVPEEPTPPPEKTAAQIALEAVKHAPAVVVAAPVGVSFREELKIDTVDPMKLPELFITRVAKESAIRAAYCQGWVAGKPIPECPGVTFKIHRSTQSVGARRA